MAEILAQISGDWNTGGNWVGGSPPGASDTFRIPAGITMTISNELAANCLGGTIDAGGQLVIAFPMTTSYFNGNITVASGGKLYFSRSATSKLRIAGNINANGVASVDCGTAADPRSDSTIGTCIEMVCTSDNQSNRSIVLGINGALTCYGMTRTLQTTLAQAAAIGSNTIVLADDLALRPGTLAQWADGLADMIVVGHTPVQTANGWQNDEIDAYLVSGYDSGTKTVTLGDAGLGQSYWPRGGVTPNWNTIDQTAREVGTPVYVLSSNVVIRGTAYNLRPSTLISGARTADPVNTLLLWGYRGGANSCTGGDWTGTHLAGHDYGLSSCTACHPSGTICGCNTGLNSCTSCNPSGPICGCGYGLASCTTCNSSGSISGCAYGLFNCMSCNHSGTITNGRYGVSTCYACTVSGAIAGMNSGGYAVQWTAQCAFLGPISACGTAVFGGSETYLLANITGCTHAMVECNPTYIANVTLNNTTELVRCRGVRAYNVVFAGATEFSGYTHAMISEYAISISRNHDGVAGAYRAWMPGGIVDSDVTVVPPGFTRSYKHQCINANKACFRPEVVLVEPGDTLRVKAYFRKDASMAYLPRIQIIDPYQDPLVSSSFSPLAEAIMTDSINTWEELNVSWQNTGTAPREVIIRACAKNASGNVYENFDIQGGGSVKIASALGRGRM